MKMSDQYDYSSSDDNDGDEADLYDLDKCFDLYDDLGLTSDELSTIELAKRRILQTSDDDCFYEGGAKKAGTG